MDREKVISALDCRANDTDLYCPICEYFRKNADDKISFCDFRSILNDALALLKEQEPYISKETRLNRDEYCRVGDVLDCFDGMDMKADEVFHAVCLIEWAMSKRSVSLDQLLKEQEAVEPRVSTAEQRCGNCNKVIEMDGWIVCPWCGKPILLEAVGRAVKRK